MPVATQSAADMFLFQLWSSVIMNTLCYPNNTFHSPCYSSLSSLGIFLKRESTVLESLLPLSCRRP